MRKNITMEKIKFNSERAPQAVGLYPHARKCGNLLFLSGVGPRVAGSKEIPGVILNEKGELMLQQRAHDKYHSPSLWTNTCCSHQRVGEGNIEAGKRRLKEEMGFTTDLKKLFHFIYQAPFDCPNRILDYKLAWKFFERKNNY